MKHMSTGLFVFVFSTAAMAGLAQPPVQVPEPGMLGLFAAAVTALLIARKFRK